MIVDALMQIVKSIMEWILDLMPTMPSYQQDQSGFLDLVSHVSYFLPLSTMAACLVSILVLHSAMNSVFILNWVIKRIRGG